LTASENYFHSWQRPSFNLLSQVQLDHIYAAALEVLARVGGEFHDPAAVALLADAGARVENDRRVRIPDTMVADALQRAPQRIVICDRDGQRRLFLEGRNTYFGPGSDTPYTLDPVTGVRRPAVLNDVAQAKLLKIMETHQPRSLPPDVLQEIAVLIKTIGASANAS
jgi:trimethylamine--corrinoid protein Co-methyltransferase